MRRDAAGRPHLDPALLGLTAALAHACPELRHVDPNRVLFVSGSARREARASIRPFGWAGGRTSSPDGRWTKPEVTIDGRAIAYEICLRPRFFLESDPAERLFTLIHELLHTSRSFDGALDLAHRHRASSAEAYAAEVEVIARRFAAADRECLAWRGELRMAAWSARPPSRIPLHAELRRGYDERDLYDAIIEQR